MGKGGDGGNGGDAYGGAAWAYSSQVRLINCTLVNNTTSGGARGEGGMYILDALPNPGSPGKAGTANGGGIALAESGTAELMNCIVWDSTPDMFSPSGSMNITYSNIQGGFVGTGNISAAPSFRNPTQGDYRLSPVSPCIDAGGAVDAPETDIDGTPRPQGDDIDMGAHEARMRAVVPNLAGLNLEEAQSLLNGEDFSDIQITYQYSNTIPEGSVISQSIAAGQETGVTTPITLVVSQGIGPEPEPEPEGEEDGLLPNVGCGCGAKNALSVKAMLYDLLDEYLLVGISIIGLAAFCRKRNIG